MLSEHVLELNNVWKKYSRDVIFHRSLREDILNVFGKSRDTQELHGNDFWALQNISFSVDSGQTVGIYGHNGAGKSTILKLLASVTHPTRGEVTVRGRIAPLIEIGAGFHPDLTGRENVFVNGAILGMRLQEIRKKYDAIVDFSQLVEFMDMPVKKYSSGMYLRLAFSIAIHSDADIYLIDEILTVGDAEFQQKCIEKIMALKKSKSMVIISHDFELMKKLVDTLVYLNGGEIDKIFPPLS